MIDRNNEALEEWISLYTEETESIWNTEIKELRRVSMLIQVIRDEFKSVENHLNNKVINLRKTIEVKKNEKRSNVSTVNELKTQLTVTSKEAMPALNRSPKLNRKRKSLRSTIISPPSYKIQQETDLNVLTPPKSKMNISLENTNISVEDIFESDDKSDSRSKVNGDVVDSSFFLQQIPLKSPLKKQRLNKKLSLKDTSKLKEQDLNTLTQMFSFPEIKSTAFNATSNKSTKSMMIKDKSKYNLESKEEKLEQFKENVSVPPSFIKNFDRIPVVKDDQPQHVHKTKTVRCKIERMKLPGWSCSDCKEYYEGLDLSPEELHRKMNICSKHRNRFPPSNETVAGFWDVGMPDTQEIQDDDLTIINSNFDS